MAEFKRSQLEEKCVKLLKSNKNLVLTGAPGTGKTFAAKKIAELMEDATWKLVQFHPSYDYTDFVEGLRPVMNSRRGIGFERKDGVFKEFCKRALRDAEGKPYVFIIDEINRGEISKIFGELFYSIDRGYRGEEGRVKTQYQNLVPREDPFYEGFYVPENVYIIGTMNDIDRSVESIDFAMRRRFAWVEFTAEESQSMLYSDDAWGDEKKPKDIDEIKARMDRLNECIVSDKIGLTRAYQIGAAYFLKYALYNDFDDLWKNHLKGVLYEYLRGAYDIEDKMKKLENAYNGRL
ncbi:AAA family ATPase [uncultured Porphyromonas sp.]|uniref:McrB family protein n=1 Tax=uncultured Porphyromonas sp. TaxID=159274 RepID=UPI002805ECD3|nr:AAA family ATPase [uncultured Porphyromonas sp.]